MTLELFSKNLATTTVSSGGTTAPVSGTTETWTVASSAMFGAAATGASQFHVADPAADSEIIAVTNVSGTTWTVTRGAESTTPVAHSAGFTIYQVTTAGWLNGVAQYQQHGLSVFCIDGYGADPTGSSLSDSAWTAAYAAATAAIQYPSYSGGTSGVVIVFGCGLYKFSTGVISVTDCRIGIKGQGKAATTIVTASTGGILVKVGGSGTEPGGMAAPVGGFGVWGVAAGANTTGFRYGDRTYGLLYDIDVYDFSAAGSVNFQVYSTTSGGVEGTDAVGVSSRLGTVGYSFDGSGGGTSFDYSRWKLHTTACGTAFQVVGGAHSVGGWIQLSGNIGDGGHPTSANLVTVGNSGSDTAKLQGCYLHISVEADSGTATITDFALDGNGSGGIIGCYGEILCINNGGTFTGGTITGSKPTFSGVVFGSPTFQGPAGGAYRVDNSLSPTYTEDAVQTLTSSGTILTATDGRFGVIPVTMAGNVTGMTLEAPALRANGLASTVTIVNRSAFTITFAASGSLVADGSSDVIAALTARSFTFDGNTSLWYRQG